MTGAHETRQQLGGLEVGRRAGAGVLVEQRSLPAREHPFGSRRAVVVDLLDRQPAQLARELTGIADGRAREAEGGVRAVVLADSSQAPEHVRDVTPEDSALRVELVDHDVSQSHHERGPALVRRQDARRGACRDSSAPRWRSCGPTIGRRCSCRRRRSPRAGRARATTATRGSWSWASALVGKMSKRRVTPVFDDGLDDRHLVAERLPRCGAGRDRDACAGPEPVDRGGLVRVEPLDAAARRCGPRPRPAAARPDRRTAPLGPEGSRGARAGPRASGSAASASSVAHASIWGEGIDRCDARPSRWYGRWRPVSGGRTLN